MNKEQLKGHSELIILGALAVRPMHGYALSQYLKDELADQFKFGVGMLYPILHRLEQKKLITGEWKQVLGADRKVYSLTRQGRKAYQEKKQEWLTFSSLVKNVIHPVVV